MTVSVATNVSEEVSLQQSQEMIMSIFSCVGYLRDLFPEESFQDHKVAGMSLKSFRRGKDRRSDQLLDWIERGCFDALSKKYLKQAILTVLSDAPGPNNVLETYTLKVTYPTSSLHQGIDASMSKLSLTRNDQPILSSLSSSSFTDSMAKILRSLCVMSQTLNALPQRKYLSMKLVYYDEVTPTGYEPPGFQAADFELEHLFVAPSVKYSFGRAINSNHGIALGMETTLSENIPAAKQFGDANTIQCNGDNLAESMTIVEAGVRTEADAKADAKQQPRKGEVETKKSKEATKAMPKPSTVATKKKEVHVNTKPSPASTIVPAAVTNVLDLASQTAQAPLSPPAFPLTQPTSEPVSQGPSALTPAAAAAPSAVQIVKCSCGVAKQALEMLQCSRCSFWQHTVCVGFISRKDRRLEEHPSDARNYSCYHCRFGNQQHTFAFLKELSLIRKAVVLLSAEGYGTLTRFSNFMEIDTESAQRIRDKLVRDGFVKKLSRSFSVPKSGNEAIKERVKYYFHQNLKTFPDFLEAQAKDGIKETPTVDLAASPKRTKKRQASACSSCSSGSGNNTFNEDFMSQTPIINKVSSSTDNNPSPPASTEPVKKKLKMSIPTADIFYD